MTRITKTQWDFSGELFPTEAIRRVYSVSELTGELRRLLEKQFGQIWINGEITNFRLQSSGHIYFTLKDASAQLSCVLFRNDPVAQRELLEDGRRVILKGELTVYEARGQCQLRVTALELQGVGALQAAFEKLKQKLNAEGLFAQERKRPLPRFPQRIGVVTSPTGAALRDIIHVVARRNRSLELILAPCLVQGTGAATEIASAIRLLNEWSDCSKTKLDLILVTRGGGSLEDLWAFNEEPVARAIFNSRLPVVSAVGHEIDFTISDFVADLRAATPSAAAEILTENVFAAYRWITQVPGRIRERLRQRFARELNQQRQFTQRLQRCHPRRVLNEKLQRLDDLRLSLARCTRHDLSSCRSDWQNLQERLVRVRPSQILEQRRAVFDQENRRLHEQLRHQLQRLRYCLGGLQDRLRLLAPEQVLGRGYSITMDAQTGRIIRNAAEAQPGQRLRTRLATGAIQSIAEEV